jgi:hypothetical protein
VYGSPDAEGPGIADVLAEREASYEGGFKDEAFSPGQNRRASATSVPSAAPSPDQGRRSSVSAMLKGVLSPILPVSDPVRRGLRSPALSRQGSNREIPVDESDPHYMPPLQGASVMQASPSELTPIQKINSMMPHRRQSEQMKKREEAGMQSALLFQSDGKMKMAGSMVTIKEALARPQLLTHHVVKDGGLQSPPPPPAHRLPSRLLTPSRPPQICCTSRGWCTTCA